MRFYKEAPRTGREEAEAKDVANGEDGNGREGETAEPESGASRLQRGLKETVDVVDGAIGVALVDLDGGLTLGVEGEDPGFLEIAGTGGLDVVRAQVRVMDQLAIEDEVEDILITLTSQYHLIRRLKGDSSLFLFLAIHRNRGNLGLARHQLRSVEGKLGI